MDYETIMNLIIAIAPALTAVLGIILAALKVVAIIKDMVNNQKASVDEQNAYLKKVAEENKVLRSQVSDLITKLDNVKRE